MSMSTRNPNEPIENLAIGQIIEVDGSRLVAELNPTLSELSRVHAGETYPIWLHHQNSLRATTRLRVGWPTQNEIRISGRAGIGASIIFG